MIIFCSWKHRELFIRHSNNPDKHRTYAYAHLRVPRYEPFQATVEQLSASGIKVREIASQHHIQIKVVEQGDSPEQLEERETQLDQLQGVSKLYTYKNGVNNGQTFFSLDVDTKRLKETVEEIQHMDGVSIKLMHDF